MTTKHDLSDLRDIVAALTEPFAPFGGDDRLEDVYKALNALREALLDVATSEPQYVALIAGPLDEAEGNLNRLRHFANELVLIGDAVSPE